MSRRHPTILELVDAVREFLEQRAMPSLDGRNAFHARVAVNALGIVRREIEHGAAAVARERRELAALLELDPEGNDVEALERELCRRLRAGELSLSTPGLTDFLWESTLARIAVDQPSYATYREMLEVENR